MDRSGFMMRWMMGGRFLGTLVLLFGLIAGYGLQPAEAQAAACPAPQSSNLAKPIYPVIFIHGINASADDTWGDMRCVLVANGWTDGGSPEWNGSSVTGVNAGNFYTLNFTKGACNLECYYIRNNHDLTFSEQGFELAQIISAVKQANSASKVILVGHSMGGLAARAYLQGLAQMDGLDAPYPSNGDVHTLITIGTPHQGSMEAQRCLDNVIACRSIAGLLLSLNPDSIAANALIPGSLDLRVLNNFPSVAIIPLPMTTLPPDVHYVSIVVTWKNQDGSERKTLTDIKKVSPYLLYEDGGDGIVRAKFQDLGQVDGFVALPAAANHTVVRVTFQDPLWNTAGLTGTEALACGHQITAGTFSINEVHTCETHDASVGYYIVQSIPKTSAGAGLPMLQNVPLRIYFDGIGQFQVGLQSSYAGPMNVQCRYSASDPSLLDPLLTSTTTLTALSYLQRTQSFSCSIPFDPGALSQIIYFQGVAQPVPPTWGEFAPAVTAAAVISPTDPNTSVGPIHQLLVPPTGGVGVLLPAPTGLSPASGSTNQPLTPTLTWDTVTGATSYRIMLAQDVGALPTDPTDGNCDRCLVDFVPGPENRTSYTPPAGLLADGTTYYWQVHARSPDNFGAWTAPSSFTTQPLTPATLLPAPTQIAPADGDTGQTTMPTLSWTSVAGATSYRIMIAPTAAALTTDPTSADCPSCLTNAVAPGAQGTTYVPYVGLLTGGQTYYWSVKARNPDSYGAWSAVRSFTPTAEAQIVTLFEGGVYLYGITGGPDGNLWFTENVGNRIGRITPGGVVTEFSAGITSGAYPHGITAGPDGNLWFTELFGNRIGRITPAGVVTEFSAGISANAGFYRIAAGPDGNIWFAEQNNRIGRITPAGVVTEFSAGITPDATPHGITAGPDGNIWFTEQSGNRIGRITPAGVVTEFSAGISANARPYSITAGPDGNLWFTEFSGNRIGRITPAGVVTEFSAGISDFDHSSVTGDLSDITTGPDGNLWFTEIYNHKIGRITPTGVVTEFNANMSGPISDITAGPDGNIWFTGMAGWGYDHQIGRITLGGAGSGGSTGGTLPSAPTIGTATAGNASISVAFTPGALGSGTLINYTADCGGVTNTGGSSPITVTGLTNGISYTCRVNTTTTVGTSAWSANSNSVTPSAPTHTLTVTKTGAGTGTVTSAPAGIDCGADCSESYASDTPVSLTATPDAGSIFVGWSGDCTSTGQVTLDADKTCTATFNLLLAISTTSLPAGEQGAAYRYALQAEGGAPPYTWSLASGRRNRLPQGFTLASDGTLTGVPTRARTTSFTVQVTDAAGASATRNLSLQIVKGVKFKTRRLTPGTVGTACSATLQVTGGISPATFSLIGGALPPGLTLDPATGQISGTPTAAGTFDFQMMVTSSGGSSDQRSIRITIR